jgi:hypothetical protein
MTDTDVPLDTPAVLTATDPDTLCINTIRTLAMDAVQAAGSGHPDTPMALAPVGYCVWQRFLRFDPTDPIWSNRDPGYSREENRSDRTVRRRQQFVAVHK